MLLWWNLISLTYTFEILCCIQFIRHWNLPDINVSVFYLFLIFRVTSLQCFQWGKDYYFPPCMPIIWETNKYCCWPMNYHIIPLILFRSFCFRVFVSWNLKIVTSIFSMLHHFIVTIRRYSWSFIYLGTLSKHLKMKLKLCTERMCRLSSWAWTPVCLLRVRPLHFASNIVDGGSGALIYNR